MSIYQITFNPTLWADGSGTGTTWGSNGYDCGNTYPDNDGETFWAFEYLGGGFARVNYSNGTIVHQNALFGTPGEHIALDTNENGNIIWTQDTSGYYYTSLYPTLYQFSVGAGSPPATGTPGTLLNGYEVINATFNLSTLPNWNPQSITVFASSGVTYIATSQFNGDLYVINANTMTLVGTWVGGSPLVGASSFVDNSGILWAMFSNSVDGSNTFVSWNPTNGATAGSLNVTTQHVTKATHELQSTAVFAAYVGASGSVLMASKNVNTGDVSLISMSSWTLSFNQPDNLEFFSFLNLNTKVQNSYLMIQGTSGTPFQQGGILRIINPAALSDTFDIDVYQSIIGAGFDPPQVFNPVNLQVAYITGVTENSGGDLTCTTSYNNLSVNSEALFTGLTGATWLNADTHPMVVTAVTPTGFSGVDPYDHGVYSGSESGFPAYAYSAGTGYPPLSSYAWNSAVDQVAVSGKASPVYLLPTVNNLYAPSISEQTTWTVTPVNTVTTIVSATPSTINPNQLVTFVVNVSAAVGNFPTEGQVQLYNQGYPFGAPVDVDPSTGNVTITTNTIFLAGDNPITAGYDDNNNFGIDGSITGDNGYYNSSTSSTTYINCTGSAPTVTTLSSTSNPAVAGSSVTYNVSVTSEAGIPTGTVTLTSTNEEGTTTLAVLTLVDGMASFTTTTTPQGTNTVVASYSPSEADELPVDVIQTQYYWSDTGGYQLSLIFPNETQSGSLILAHQLGDGLWLND